MARARQWLYMLLGQVCPYRTTRDDEWIADSTDRDQGVNAIEQLMEKRGAFDYILLETSGVADPGNIAPMFWVDEGLGSTIYLDGIVVLADAKNIIRSLDESRSHAQNADDDAESREEYQSLTTAHLQLSHADVIVLNKVDTVSVKELEEVKARLRGINGMAKVIETEYGKVPSLEGVILDLHAYDSMNALQMTEGHGHPDPVRLARIPSFRVLTLFTEYLDRYI